MGMPAKIGPKRDRALARTGCYFDGSATRCGAEVFGLRRESGCVRAIMIVMLACAGVQCTAASPRHCERSEAMHSFFVPAHGIASLAIVDVH
jgi:hypothetical protein